MVEEVANQRLAARGGAAGELGVEVAVRLAEREPVATSPVVAHLGHVALHLCDVPGAERRDRLPDGGGLQLDAQAAQLLRVGTCQLGDTDTLLGLA